MKDITSESIKSLTIGKIDKELRERTPTLHTILAASAISSRSQKSASDFIPAIAVAASVLLKERCQRINGLQLMITIIMKFTGFHVQNIN